MNHNDEKLKENLEEEELRALLSEANAVLDEMEKKDNENTKQIDEIKGKVKDLMDKINNNFSELDDIATEAAGELEEFISKEMDDEVEEVEED